MPGTADRPFGSIEDTQEFIGLLCDAIEEAIQEIEQEKERARTEKEERRIQALSLATYKLAQLKMHVTQSRRIVNDLRSIRRLMSAER